LLDKSIIDQEEKYPNERQLIFYSLNQGEFLLILQDLHVELSKVI